MRGIRSHTNSRMKENMPSQGLPCFLKHHPRNGVVHDFQPHPRRLSRGQETSRCLSCDQSSLRKYPIELPGKGKTGGGGLDGAKGSPDQLSNKYIGLPWEVFGIVPGSMVGNRNSCSACAVEERDMVISSPVRLQQEIGTVLFISREIGFR